MQIPPRTIEQIAAGEVTLAFRRWAAPRVKAGSTQRSALGVIEITTVDEVETITEGEAKLAGFESAAKLLALVDKKSTGGQLYRIGVRYQGADPRAALREVVDIDEATSKRLRRMPWARTYLELIRDNPEVVSTELAAQIGMPRPDFKLRVRRLKDLGLTESLRVGYRISARGRAYLEAGE